MQQHLTIVTAPVCGPQTALHERVPQKKLQCCSQEIKSAEEQHKVISRVLLVEHTLSMSWEGVGVAALD